MACIFGPSLNNRLYIKMRLAEITTVSKFELLNKLCARVTADSVIRLFFAFQIDVQLAYF